MNTEMAVASVYNALLAFDFWNEKDSEWFHLLCDDAVKEFEHTLGLEDVVAITDKK